MTMSRRGVPRNQRTPVFERASARVIYGPGCWIYTGSDNGVGYGVVGSGGHDGSNIYVHRLFYEQYVGQIPEGLVLDHLCRNRRCCNPDHLEPVTHRVNLLRGVGVSARNAVKTACPAGHAYDEANTYINPNTEHRVCRACARAYQRRLRASRRQAVA